MKSLSGRDTCALRLIYDSQDMGVTSASISGRVGEENTVYVLYIHYVVLFSHRKEGNPAFCDNIFLEVITLGEISQTKTNNTCSQLHVKTKTQTHRNREQNGSCDELGWV